MTEAPPPCEACKTYLRSEPSHIALNEWLKMFDEHHRIIAELRADNARLRKALRRRVRAHELGQTYKWDEEDKAALAPKVSHE